MSFSKRIASLKAFHSAAEELPVMDDYDIERIEAYIRGLFSFAKFETGDKVFMAETYPVNAKDSPGWMAIRHLLRKGTPAKVRSVDWYEGRFVYMVGFYENTWIDDKDEIHIASGKTGCLQLSEKWLASTAPSGMSKDE